MRAEESVRAEVQRTGSNRSAPSAGFDPQDPNQGQGNYRRNNNGGP